MSRALLLQGHSDIAGALLPACLHCCSFLRQRPSRPVLSTYRPTLCPQQAPLASPVSTDWRAACPHVLMSRRGSELDLEGAFDALDDQVRCWRCRRWRCRCC